MIISRKYLTSNKCRPEYFQIAVPHGIDADSHENSDLDELKCYKFRESTQDSLV